MPFNPDMSLLDSSFLSEFLTDCDLPATIEIVEGYDSNESVEQSWSQGEIVYLHAMKELPQVRGQDGKGNQVCIPLKYPEKIFESIPNRCRDKYDTIEEVIRDFPKYVRSLRNIPQSGVKVGDALLLLETSPNAAGRMDLKCKVAGTPRSITLPGDQVGPFEALEDVHPATMRDIIDRHLLPTRVRVRGGTQVFHETNNNEKIHFKGLFTIKEIVQQKVLIVSTLHEKVLRVFKLPIDLEIRVRKENLNIDPKLFSEICRLIDREVIIDSTIISGDGEASWMFDLADIVCKGDVDVSEDDEVYESITPPVPPRSPSKLSGSNSKQTCTNINTPQSETRYAPAPKPKPSRKTVSAEDQKGDGKKVPPQVLKKPNVHKSHHPVPPLVVANKANTTTQNLESHIESKRSEAISNHNRPDAGDRTRDVGHTLPVSPSKPESTNTALKPVVQKGSTKPVPLQLVKPKPNALRQKSIEELEQTPSSHCSGPDETEGDYECISTIPSVSPTGNPVSPVVSVKESVKAAPLSHGKPTPSAIKQKPVKKQLPRSQHSAPALQNSSSLKKCENKDSPTKVTSQKVEFHSESALPAARSVYKRSDTAIKPVVQKGSTKPVPLQLVKPKPNALRQKSVEEVEQTPSSHCSGPDETEDNYEYISNIPSVLPQKAKPTGNPVSPVVSVKESVKAAPLSHGKPTPSAIKQKPVEEQLPRSQHSAPALKNSSTLKKCENKDSPTEVTSQNTESHSESALPAARSDYKRSDDVKDNTGLAQDKGKELLKDISVSEVSGWLTKLGLSEYVDRFAEESIDGNFLLELNTELMEYLGISNPLHRKKLTMFIQKGWTPKK